MHRKILLVTVLGSALWLSWRWWNQPVTAQPAASASGFVHMVAFTVKKDVSAQGLEEVITDGHKLLARIPSVKGLWIGRPAERATPDVAVKDYDLGLLVLFENYDGLKAYLDHDLHQEFVRRHKGKFDRVLVYDFVDRSRR